MGVICLHCPARISRQLGQMERPPNKFLIHGDWDENGKFGDENGENNGHILNIRRFEKTLTKLQLQCFQKDYGQEAYLEHNKSATQFLD